MKDLIVTSLFSLSMFVLFGEFQKKMFEDFKVKGISRAKYYLLLFIMIMPFILTFLAIVYKFS